MKKLLRAPRGARFKTFLIASPALCRMLAAVAILIFSLHPATLIAGGFQVSDHGAAGAGRARAYVASVMDASAVYHNPAAMAFFKSGLNLNLTGTLLAPQSVFQQPSGAGVTTTYTNGGPTGIPAGYLTYTSETGFALGIGAYFPYGLGIDWPTTGGDGQAWAGRGIITNLSLRNLFVTGNVAYRFSDQFSLSAGISFISGTAKLQRNITDFGSPEGRVTLDGTGTGIGFNGALMFKPDPAVSIGLTYKSQINMTYKGDAVFTSPGTLSEADFPDGPGSVALPLPSSFKAGIAYRPAMMSESFILKNLEFEADFDYHLWSAYSELPISFEKTSLYVDAISVSQKNFQNSYTISFAAETRWTEKVRVRAGFLYDKAAVPDGYVEPLLPDADRLGVSVGFGYEFAENIGVDVAGVFVRANQRTQTTALQEPAGLTGTYNTSSPVVSASLRVKF